jgi:hypothetical protein
MNTLSKMMILMVMSGVVSIAHADTAVVQAPVSTSSSVPVSGGRFDHKVQKQEARIDKKVAEGKITAAQGAKMKQDVEAVVTQKNAMIAQNGGKKLTKAQRQTIHQDLKQTSQEIKGSSPVTPVTNN